MRTKIIAFLLAVLTCLGALNLYQSIKERLVPNAIAGTQEVSEETSGNVSVRIRTREKIRVRARSNVRESESDCQAVPEMDAFVSLTRVGDDELLSETFTLTRAMEIGIFALGEGVGGQMYDFAWIVDTSTGRPVCVMRHRDTDHAGGGDKNRLFDGRIGLEKGSYRVYYISDGSHSYEDWNVSAPANEEYWGVSLYTDESSLKKVKVGMLEGDTGGDVIAQLVRMGDDEHVSMDFRLKESTRVHIYALGEGDWSGMYDFAWIEDADTGRRACEMKSRTTEHDGGDAQN